jgi:hypothetical protein
MALRALPTVIELPWRPSRGGRWGQRGSPGVGVQGRRKRAGVHRTPSLRRTRTGPTRPSARPPPRREHPPRGGTTRRSSWSCPARPVRRSGPAVAGSRPAVTASSISPTSSPSTLRGAPGAARPAPAAGGLVAVEQPEPGGVTTVLHGHPAQRLGQALVLREVGPHCRAAGRRSSPAAAHRRRGTGHRARSRPGDDGGQRLTPVPRSMPSGSRRRSLLSRVRSTPPSARMRRAFTSL